MKPVRVLIAVGLLAISCMAVSPSGADANYWRHCGNMPLHSTFDIKAHQLHCGKARAVIRKNFYDSSPYDFSCVTRSMRFAETFRFLCRRKQGHRLQRVRWVVSA